MLEPHGGLAGLELDLLRRVLVFVHRALHFREPRDRVHGVEQVVERQLGAREHLPPLRLLVAAVELEQVGHQRAAVLRGGPVGLLVGQVGEQRCADLLDLVEVGLQLGRRRAGGGSAGAFGGVILAPRHAGRALRQQPLVQQLQRHDVVLVVALDLLEQRLVAGLEVALVVDDARAGGLHVALARLAVELLDVLDGVRGRGRADGFADDLVEVHQAPFAQERVEQRLARGVTARELLERGVLVGGVVVDVQAGVFAPALVEPVHELLERLLLLEAGVAPEGLELEGALAVPVVDAEQVLEPVVAVERVAFHVEVHVARVGRRQLGEPARLAGRVLDEMVVQLAGLAAEQLHRGLLAQLGERLLGEVGDLPGRASASRVASAS